MKNNSYYIYIILTLAITMNWLTVGRTGIYIDLNLDLIPKKSLIIIEVLQAFLFCKIIFLYRKYNFIKISIILLILFSIHQLIIHITFENHLTIWLSGLRYYLSFVPLLLLGYVLGVKKISIEKELRYLIILVFLQVPVTFIQFLQAPKLSIVQGASLFDIVSGTMGGWATNLLAAFMCFGILYSVIKYFDENKSKYLIGAVVCIIPSILGDAKGMIILLFIISAYLIIIQKINLKNYFKISFAALLLIIAFTNIYYYLDLGHGVDFGFLFSYFQSASGADRLSRVDSILYAFSKISENFAALFGYGIGSANSNPLGPTPPFDNFYTIRHSLDILITETGWTGLILLTISLIYSFIISFRVVRRLKNVNSNEALIAKIVGGMILILSVSLIWTDLLFRVQFMYPFGLLLGYTLGIYKYLNINK